MVTKIPENRRNSDHVNEREGSGPLRPPEVLVSVRSHVCTNISLGFFVTPLPHRWEGGVGREVDILPSRTRAGSMAISVRADTG